VILEESREMATPVVISLRPSKKRRKINHHGGKEHMKNLTPKEMLYITQKQSAKIEQKHND
jgi:hypothetical protein